MIKEILNRPIGVLLSTFTLFLLGLGLLTRIPLTLLPEFSIPQLSIDYSDPSRNAIDMEANIISKTRQGLGGLKNIKSIESFSQTGRGTIIIHYQWGTNMQDAYLSIQEKLDELAGVLPAFVDRPVVNSLNQGSIPVLQIAFKDSKHDDFSQNKFAENVIRRQLEQLPGVSKCELAGGKTAMISILPQSPILKSLDITTDELINKIHEATAQTGKLRFREGIYEYSIHIKNAVQDKDMLGQLPIRVGDSRIVPLNLLAKISISPKDEDTAILDEDGSCIYLGVYINPDANLLNTITQINSTLSELKNSYPEISLTVIQDESLWVKTAIFSLSSGLIIGILVSVTILFVFIRSWKLPFLMAVSVPLSLAITFFVMWSGGLSINIVTLAGLIIASGILVDNSIIILEAMYRHLKERNTSLASAEKGLREVGLSMIGATLTNLCVFLPLTFFQGITGVFFRDLFITLSAALIISLLIALIFLPVCFRFFAPSNFYSTSILAMFLLKGYHISFARLLRKPLWGMTLFGSSIVFGVGMIYFLQAGTIPDIHYSEKILMVQWENNFTFEHNLKKSAVLADQLRKIEGVAQVITLAGKFDNPESPIPTTRRDTKFSVLFSGNVSLIQEKISDYLKSTYPQRPFSWQNPGLQLVMFLPDQQSYNWDLYLNSALSSALLDYPSTKAFIDSIQKIPGITNIFTPCLEQNDVQVLIWDEEKLARYNIKNTDIIQAVNELSGNTIIGNIQHPDGLLPIMLEGTGTDQSLENWLKQPISGYNIPLGACVQTQHILLPEIIYAGKEGPKQWIRLSVEKNSVIKELEERVTQIASSMELQIQFDGSIYRSKQLVFENIRLLGVGILLLFLVMAAQFESLLQPIIVLFTGISGIAGSLFSLWVMNQSLNLFSGMGILIASGIIVNDSILKIDGINQYRKQGYGVLYAIIRVGKERFQSIILTSLTTIFAMAPLLLFEGIGAELQKPLVIAIIGGISLSTISALYILPVFYLWAYRKKS